MDARQSRDMVFPIAGSIRAQSRNAYCSFFVLLHFETDCYCKQNNVNAIMPRKRMVLSTLSTMGTRWHYAEILIAYQDFILCDEA